MANPDLVNKLLIGLGAKPKVTGEKWITSSCIFAPWHHKKGVDTNPSFGVNYKEASPVYNCFTCQSAGELTDVLPEIKHLYKKFGCTHSFDFPYLASLIEQIDASVDAFDLPDYDQDISANHFIEFPDHFLEGFPKAYDDKSVHPYLKERKVSRKVAELLDARYDPIQKRLCFPFWDRYQRLAGVIGRDTTGFNDPKHFQYGYNKHRNSNTFLNEHRIDWDEPVVLVEGSFDLAAVFPVYQNVLASFSTQLTEAKFKKLEDCYSVVTFYDQGEGGNIARNKIYGRLSPKKIKVKHAIPTASDPGDMSAPDITEVLADLI